MGTNYTYKTKLEKKKLTYQFRKKHIEDEEMENRI